MDVPEGSESQQQAESTVAVIEAKDAPAHSAAPSAALTVSAESLAPSIEALLLSVDKAVPGPRIAEALGLIQDAEDPKQAALAEAPETADEAAGNAGASGGGGGGGGKKSKKPKAITPGGLVQGAIDHLNAQYQQTGRAFRIQKIAGGYRVMTLASFAPVLERYHGKRERHGISRAALESLAIIAYKQPITRAGLEAIRGVSCGEVLRSLIERRLVTIVGRAEELGRPMLYGTTKAFLETFGLSSVKDLPSPDELRAKVGAEDNEQD